MYKMKLKIIRNKEILKLVDLLFKLKLFLLIKKEEGKLKIKVGKIINLWKLNKV